MDLIQLRVPPEKAIMMADSIERDIATRTAKQDIDQLTQLLTWLRYRISLWNARTNLIDTE